MLRVGGVGGPSKEGQGHALGGAGESTGSGKHLAQGNAGEVVGSVDLGHPLPPE